MEIGMKEYLNKLKDGIYKLVVLSDVVDGHDGLIEIPEGAEVATASGLAVYFWKPSANETYIDNQGWHNWTSDNQVCSFDSYLDDSDVSVVWERETLNDQVASAETARQSEKVLKEILEGNLPEFDFELNVEQDNVNSPNHYKKGNVECIDAIQSSMTHDAFCGYLKGNVQKYMWRYENKGGVESLKKAQWYLNKLIEVQNGNS